MSSEPFKKRTRELADLASITTSGKAQMLVLYGRRRIGKTSLLRHWAATSKAPSFYWTGYRTTSEQLLESFSDRHAEIDLLAINWHDRNALFGECKWTTTKMNRADLESLQTRAAKLTKLKDFAPSYALFSKSGFTADLKKNLPENTRLFQGGAFEEMTP